MDSKIFTRLLFFLMSCTLMLVGLMQPLQGDAATSSLVYHNGKSAIKQSLPANPTANLAYHGGPVMVGTVTTYAIFWEPPGRYVSPHYNSLILRYFHDVGGTPLYHNLSQYYNSHGTHPVTSILGGSWVDTRPYPTNNNELQETDIQNEVTHAMQVNGWSPSIHTMFFVFSAKGEIMCSDASNYGCTFINDLCAWHNYMGTNTIYGAMPYTGTDLSLCGVPHSPNHDFDADGTINLITHEQMEAETDPLYTGWYETSDPYHSEIGDKCVWQFGPQNRYGGDVVWHGHPYEVQLEWDNAQSACVLKGP